MVTAALELDGEWRKKMLEKRGNGRVDRYSFANIPVNWFACLARNAGELADAVDGMTIYSFV
jgi:hypothetical protein